VFQRYLQSAESSFIFSEIFIFYLEKNEYCTELPCKIFTAFSIFRVAKSTASAALIISDEIRENLRNHSDQIKSHAILAIAVTVLLITLTARGKCGGID